MRVHAVGGPEQLVIEQTAIPELRDGDVLVRVLSCGLTRGELSWGPTYTDENGVNRLPSIPGHDLCGIVEKATPGVKSMPVGCIVYGLGSFFRDGAAAEYIAVNAAEVAPKPQSLNANIAAAVPLSGLTAWQALFDHGGLTSGKRVLIHGAAGAVGTFAVQLAHWCRAEVIAMTSKANFKTVKALGSDQVLDYAGHPFEEKIHDIDIVLDTIGGEIQARSWNILRRGGILVTIAGESVTVPDTHQDKRGVFFIIKSKPDQLLELGKLIDRGVLHPVLSSVFSLDEGRPAFEKLTEPGKQGKIVLQIAEK